MSAVRLGLLGLVLVALAARPVRADDAWVTEARGSAAGAGDSARTAAIDQAFAAAVDQALTALVADAVRTAHRADLDQQVVRRARLFVASYRVVEETTAEGQVAVKLSVSVSRDKLAAALAELGITAKLATAEAPPAPASDAPGAVILLELDEGGDHQATFGKDGGDGGGFGRALAAALTERGFAVRSAVGAAIPVSGEGSGAAPMSDAAAAAVATSVGADAVWLIGIGVQASGPIRATRLVGATGRVVARVLDRGQLVAEAKLEAGGFGAAAAAASKQTLAELGRKLDRALDGDVARHWPRAPAGHDPGAVTVTGATSWGPVAAIIRRLAATTGVKAVNVRELGRGRVVLGIDSELAAAAIAAAVEGAHLRAGQLTVHRQGEHDVAVGVEGDDAQPAPEVETP